MTLTKAIEAARYFLEYSRGCDISNTKQCVNDALAALPDKPKSEDELLLIVKKHVKGMANPETVRATIQALKAANVLFVKED